MRKLYFVVYEVNGLNQNTKYKERVEGYAIGLSVEDVIAGIFDAQHDGVSRCHCKAFTVKYTYPNRTPAS